MRRAHMAHLHVLGTDGHHHGSKVPAFYSFEPERRLPGSVSEKNNGIYFTAQT
jgi:hypothetical protein